MADVRKVSGVVDRIEGNVVIVTVRDPQNPENPQEVAVPRTRIKKVDLREGDRITVVV